MTAGRSTVWASRIRAALESLGGSAKLSDLYEEIERNISDPLSPAWRSTVRQTLQAYCREARYFAGKEELFVHKGQGLWGLRKAGEEVNAKSRST